MSISRLTLSACTLMIAGLSTGTANAQSAGDLRDSVEPSDGQVTAVEKATEGEIVVTAQRREQRLSETPVAVAVLSGEELRAGGLTTEADLALAVPGLLVQAGDSSNQINFVVRGQATDPFSNTRPGVLPYFNEVQISGPGGSGAFFDLQSVQLLKGPQGTLFGRNSTGGAVLFTTGKPGSDFDGYVSGSLGSYDLRRIEGAVGGPLSDMAGVRVAGFYEGRNGVQRNLLTNTKIGNRDRFALRGTLVLKPTDTLSNELVLEYFEADETNVSNVLFDVDPAFPSPLPAGILYSPALDSVFNFPGAFAAVRSAAPGGSPTGLVGDLALQQQRGPYEVSVRGPNFYQAKNVIISNVTKFEVANNVTLKNIFGYGNFDLNVGNNPFGTVYEISNLLKNNTRNEQFSNEVQLQGKGGNLEYTAGIYFSRETTDSDFLNLVADLAPLAPGPRPRNLWGITNTTWAGYAQGTFDLENATKVEGLAITLGARYTREKISFALSPEDDSYAVALVDPLRGVEQSKVVSNVSWVARLEYQVDSDALLYTSVRRSFRNGGYNGLVEPFIGLGNSGGNGYATEQLTDAELGLKLDGYVADRPASLNVAAFYSWIKNNQRTAFAADATGAPAAITVNVPKAIVQGIEADGTFRPTDWLQLGASANYTKGKFTDNQVSILGAPPIPFTTFPYAPKFSGNFYTAVTVPVTDAIDLDLRGEIYRQSSFYFSPTGSVSPNVQLPGYTLANFRVGVNDDEAGWSVTANLRNAFNRKYFVGGISAVQLFQLAAVQPGAPRTFSVEASFRF
jgi:iron complex outermembrane receptor protein